MNKAFHTLLPRRHLSTGRAIAITPNDMQLKSVADTKLLLEDKNIHDENFPQQAN